MSSWAISALNVLITALDLIMFPMTFLTTMHHPWRRHVKRPKHYQPPEFVLDPDSGELVLNPEHPEATCANKEIMDKEGLDTMDKVFNFMTKKYLNKPCLGTRKVLGTTKRLTEEEKILKKVIFEDKYYWLTYKEVSEQVNSIAAGLQSIGVKSGDKVLIFADTCPEWMILALACFKFAVTVVTLYSNLGDEGVVSGINQVNVQVVVTNQSLLPKLLALRTRTPSVKTIVVIEDRSSEKKLIYLKQNGVRIVPFLHMMASKSKGSSPMTWKKPTPDTIAVIMYTSGTTGRPKGVMLTHGNLTSSLKSCCPRACNLLGHHRYPEEAYLAYLPLAHIFELTQEFIVLSLGIKIGYSSPSTLTDSSSAILPGHKGDISILRPTVMSAVPLILDRIYKLLRNRIGQKGMSFQALFDYAVSYRTWWIKKGYDTPILNKILFGKIRNSLGGRLETIIAGGAPLCPDVHDFLRSTLGIHLAQGYGLTESSGGVSLSTAEDLSVGKVGQLLPGVRIKLRDWRVMGYFAENKIGEILIGGPMISQGYFDDLPMTSESFYTDPDGKTRWFQTGDIGYLDANDASLSIIDRKKDLVKLQMGEYVSLGKVEAWIKVHHLVDNVCVVADSSQTFCVGIVVPDVAKLTELALSLGISRPFDELCQYPEVIQVALELITKHAERSLEKFEIPKKLHLTSKPWTPDSGLVTAALKLKRKQIMMKYQDEIRLLYTDKCIETPKLKTA